MVNPSIHPFIHPSIHPSIHPAHVTMNDLEWALDKERMGPEKKNKIDDAEALRRTASHEAGHTIVNYFTEHVRD